jgi:predicted nucleic acid-binding protein
MKEMFRGYYRPTDEEFKKLWDDCLFVLDTNVLLNFYRYSEKTSKDFFSILEKISDRVWVPYQVAYEYHKNRLEEISNKKRSYRDLCKIIEDTQKKLVVEIKKYERHPYIEISSLENKVDDCFSDIKKQIEEKEKGHPDLIKEDPIREKISILLKGKIGQKFSDEQLEETYKKGRKRYDEKVPPGFRDQEKGGNSQYGDLVLWFEIIEKAKQTNKPVILVIDDNKEDWWTILQKETIGPRPELIQEFFSEANSQFYMYKPEQFMHYAGEYLGQKFDSKTVDEIREISKEKIVSPSVFTFDTDSSMNLPVFTFHEIDTDTQFFLNKRKKLEREIIENKTQLVRLKIKYDEDFSSDPFGSSIGMITNITTVSEIELLERRIQELNKLKDDIDKILFTPRST